MELHLGHVYLFIFFALPLIWFICGIAYIAYRGYQLQKDLKAQSDALFEKLENH